MRAQKNRDQSREQRKRREVPTLDGVQHSVVQRFATGVVGGRTDARPTAVGQSAPEGDQEISQEICRRDLSCALIKASATPVRARTP